jgi:putative spermidine/putrescine transport system ATP-binding protein
LSRKYLEIIGASKTYDGQAKAMDIPWLAVERGEFVSFLGPSGSGKTTTLMTIAGFQSLSEGTILLNGRSLEDVPPHKRNIGVVFQNYALFPHLSVADNVYYPLRMRGQSKAQSQDRIATALNMVGLSGVSDRLPKQLSGGQQQRVALARTLVFNPDLILLDEPLGALDKALREQMQVELRRIHREFGVTMVYVTHDQTEAMTMSDRIAVFANGRIDQIGTPSDVYLRPTTRFVASFVGDSNLLPGIVRGPGLVDVAGLGALEVPPGSWSAGQTVEVMMRPEIFRLKPLTGSEGPEVQIAGIDDMINYGDSQLVLVTAGDTPLRVRVLSTDVVGLAPGSRCALSWDAAYLHVLS